jgi:glycosyltransferase involved in cell wall biosynthesis
LSLFQIDTGREWRGGQRQALLLAREVRKRGYPLTFVVQPGSPLHEKAAAENLPLLPVTVKGEADLRASLRISRAMKRNGCVLAHFHDAHAVAVGGRASRWAQVPVRVISRRVDFPLKKNPFSRRKYARDIDLIIAISEGVRDVLLQGGIPPERIAVVPSGIDFSPFEENPDRGFLRREFGFAPDDYLVGIVAHLESHKGHAYLIEAARILKSRAPKMKFIIVGKGSLELTLEEQARGLGVDDIVYFLGFREDVPRILASLDLFVLSSYLEGLGSSIMDAMASRLPVVATMVGGIPELVKDGETGLLVLPRDPASLADGIERLHKDRALARRLGDKGFEVVHRQFSAEAMAGRIIDQYEALASRKGLNLYA